MCSFVRMVLEQIRYQTSVSPKKRTHRSQKTGLLLQDKKAGRQPNLCRTVGVRTDSVWFCGKLYREAFHRVKGWRKKLRSNRAIKKIRSLLNLKKNKKGQYTSWPSNKQMYMVITIMAWPVAHCTRVCKCNWTGHGHTRLLTPFLAAFALWLQRWVTTETEWPTYYLATLQKKFAKP